MAKAALASTQSRRAAVAVLSSTESKMRAASSGVSPPESSSGRQRPKPICSGVKTCSFSGVATLNSEVSEISS